MKKLTQEQKDKVIEIISKNSMIESGDINESDTFKELGMDSLEYVETIMAIEKEFNCFIPDDEADGVETVEELLGTVALFI